jgi:hypothetical protein
MQRDIQLGGGGGVDSSTNVYDPQWHKRFHAESYPPIMQIDGKNRWQHLMSDQEQT